MTELGVNSIDRFKNEVAKRGIFRPNRFRVDVLRHPVAGVDTSSLYLYATDAVIPGASISTNEVKQIPQTYLQAYGRTYTTSNIDFLIDRDFQWKEFFDSWMNRVVNRNTMEVGYYNDFVGEIVVCPLSTDEQAPYHLAIVLMDAYPTAIADIAVKSSLTNQAATMQVTFSYKKWIPFPEYVNRPAEGTYGGRLEGGAFRVGGKDAFIRDETTPKVSTSKNSVLPNFKFDKLETTGSRF